MIDIHNHLLYGVDDGPKTIEESIEMLRDAKQQGVEAIILTPHYRHGMFAYPVEVIDEHFGKLLKEAKQIGIRLYLGTEYHVNSRMIEYLETGRCRTMAGTNYVLAEYEYETPYEYIISSVRDLLRHGYIPIIAHAERYACMLEDVDCAEQLREMGVLIQVNADAVLGDDGRKLKKYCKKMLQNGYVDVIGSDSHGIKRRASQMQKCQTYMYKKYDENYVEQLFVENPKKILDSVKK